MSDEVLSLARQYASVLGWRLIPLYALGSRAKRPRGSRWPERSTNSIDRIENWYASYKDDSEGISFGVVTGEGSGIFCIDVDDPDKGWLDLLEDKGELPKTPTVLSGSGGHHYYFAYPSDRVVSSGTSIPVKGVDIRAEGGMIVLPPSPHPSGNTYEWLNSPFDSTIAECPAWLLKAIKEQAGNTDWLPLDAVWDVDQNGHLHHYARMLIHTDWDEDEIRQHFLTKWRSGEIPDTDPLNKWTEASILEPVASGIKAALDQMEAKVPNVNGSEPQQPLRFGSPLGLTDEDNAIRLAYYFDRKVLYATGPGWHVWDTQRWRHDPESLLVGRLAERTTRRIQAEANQHGGKDAERLRKWAKASRNVSRIQAMVSLGRKQKDVKIEHEELDGDATVELLNVADCTLNLRTLECKTPDPMDRITKVCPYPWDSEAPHDEWLQTLDYAFGGDQQMIDFLQRAVGYSLTGLVPEHMFICWGALGMNAKSTIMENLYGAIGSDYATSFNARAVMGAGNENFALSTLAGMRGSRFATASETGENDFLNEDLVKAVTGGDTLSVKFMRQDTFEYRPRFKVWVRTNNRPKVKSTDDPIWRRLVLIPFTNQVPVEARRPRYEVDEMLTAERPGILRWAIEGAQQFFERGFDFPPQVVAATAEYRADNDPIGMFVSENCELVKDESCYRSEFKRQLDYWVQEQYNWRKGPSTMKITEYLQSHYDVGVESTGGNSKYIGIKTLAEPEEWEGR
ncbi:hypothetical protein LCGC14_0693630 [marine sediment metagenome]|uniref:SF3 helicase domain-containing protein n=1 Tax=marine sediment metagenome TaxID=412755 RepID=A0A0F9R514_9ZZZZ